MGFNKKPDYCSFLMQYKEKYDVQAFKTLCHKCGSSCDY